MKLIVGLGNPGRKYQGTPHNVGFEVADLLAERWGVFFKPKSRESADVAEARVGSEVVLLAKPTTFVNLSGNAVRELSKNRPLEPADLLILGDDTNLPLGRLRIRSGGSHGGHNGLRSVIESLGTEEFSRLRIGVQPKGGISDRLSFVVGKSKPAEREQLEIMAQIAADAAEEWVRNGLDETANRYNGRREFGARDDGDPKPE